MTTAEIVEERINGLWLEFHLPQYLVPRIEMPGYADRFVITGEIIVDRTREKIFYKYNYDSQVRIGLPEINEG